MNLLLFVVLLSIAFVNEQLFGGIVLMLFIYNRVIPFLQGLGQQRSEIQNMTQELRALREKINEKESTGRNESAGS